MKIFYLSAVIFGFLAAFQPATAGLTESATSTAEVSSATLESSGRWNGLEAQQILNSPFSSAVLKSKIKQLPAVAEQSLPIPVLFGVSRFDLIPNFGEARGGSRTHEGLDIPVPKGAPIVSPTEAVVLSVGTGANSGNTVSTANPGGETFVYMHLDRIAALKAGDMLAPGDLIGYAGSTGNAAGGAAHLHFEIRNNGAANPYPRLTGEFTVTQKMAFTGSILAKSGNEAGLAKFFASTYPEAFRTAKTAGISVPAAIAALIPVWEQSAPEPATTALATGSRGGAVAALQAFLIDQHKGAASTALGRAGATGYFGALTRAALVEYQTKTGLAPANGVYAPTGNGTDILSGLIPKQVTASIAATVLPRTSIADLKTMILKLQAQILSLQIQLLKMRL